MSHNLQAVNQFTTPKGQAGVHTIMVTKFFFFLTISDNVFSSTYI